MLGLSKSEIKDLYLLSVPLFYEKNKEIKVSYELCARTECFLPDQLRKKKKTQKVILV